LKLAEERAIEAEERAKNVEGSILSKL